jgi:hypothetical protein
MGEKTMLATVAAELAECLYVQARLDEAAVEAARSAELADVDDVEAQVLWRAVKAKCLAAAGDGGAAEDLAAEAVALAAGTDQLNLQGAASLALAQVCCEAGRRDEAQRAAADAAAAFEQKGNVVSARGAAALQDRAGATR